MTKKQKRDIDSMLFFSMDSHNPTEEEIRSYSDYSTNGGNIDITDGIRAIQNGKMYREAHIEMWKNDIKNGLLSKSELSEDQLLTPINWLIARIT